MNNPIQTFIARYWSDQKLAEVYAFNEDGKMRYVDPCACFLGVTLANTLHTNRDKCSGSHYVNATRLEGARAAEAEYLSLDFDLMTFILAIGMGLDRACERTQQKRLAVILRAEMQRREQLRRVSIPPPVKSENLCHFNSANSTRSTTAS